MRSTTTARRGTVPIEIVLTFPVVTGMIMLALAIARTGGNKIATTIDVRGETWAIREDAQPTEVMKRDHDIFAGWVETERQATTPIRVPPARLGTTFGTWDHEQFEFPPFPNPPREIRIHLEQLTALVNENPETLEPIRIHLGALRSTRSIDPSGTVRPSRTGTSPDTVASFQQSATRSLSASRGNATPEQREVIDRAVSDGE